MTNAEKYLKDGVVAKELWKTFQAYYYKNKSKESDVAKAFRNFFEEETKPTLTADERVILRNINKEASIWREKGKLWIYCEGNLFNEDIFQFIKERRRILY